MRSRGSVECGEAYLERRDSAGCGVAQQGAAWLSGERSGSFGAGGLLGQCRVYFRVRRSAVGSASGSAGPSELSAITRYETGPERERSF